MKTHSNWEKLQPWQNRLECHKLDIVTFSTNWLHVQKRSMDEVWVDGRARCGSGVGRTRRGVGLLPERAMQAEKGGRKVVGARAVVGRSAV